LAAKRYIDNICMVIDKGVICWYFLILYLKIGNNLISLPSSIQSEVYSFVGDPDVSIFIIILSFYHLKTEIGFILRGGCHHCFQEGGAHSSVEEAREGEPEDGQHPGGEEIRARHLHQRKCP